MARKGDGTIRLISLENCPEAFDREITRTNNTQNRIERRDFVALDREQERIRNELHLEAIMYVYKSGEIIPGATRGFDLVDAGHLLRNSGEEGDWSAVGRYPEGALQDPVQRISFRPEPIQARSDTAGSRHSPGKAESDACGARSHVCDTW